MWRRRLLPRLSRLRSCESAYVMLLHGVLHSFTCCTSQHLKDRRGWRSENLDACCGIQRLVVYASGAFADHTHVRLKRVGVRMDLNDSHLRSFVVHVLVEGQKTWFIGFDEVNQSRDALSLRVNLSRLEPVCGDENERSRYRTPPCRPASKP